jgi:hypothetical protein
MFDRLKLLVLLGYQRALTARLCVKLFATIALLFPIFCSAQNVRNVLVLHTYNANMTPNRLWSQALHETFDPNPRNQLYEEYFDNDRATIRKTRQRESSTCET